MLHVRVVAADGHAAATVTVPSATSATRVLLTSAVLAFRPPPATPTTAAEATRRMKRTMPLEDAGDSDEGSDDSSSSDDTGAAGGGGGDDAVREASDADTEAELDPYVALGHRMFKEGRLLDTHRTVQENGLRDGGTQRGRPGHARRAGFLPVLRRCLRQAAKGGGGRRRRRGSTGAPHPTADPV